MARWYTDGWGQVVIQVERERNRGPHGRETNRGRWRPWWLGRIVGDGGHGNSGDDESVELPRDRRMAVALGTKTPARSGKGEHGLGERVMAAE